MPASSAMYMSSRSFMILTNPSLPRRLIPPPHRVSLASEFFQQSPASYLGSTSILDDGARVGNGYEVIEKWDCPEIAVLGKSNVGKSSLLNAVFGMADGNVRMKDQLVKVSRRAGHTKQLNYFGLKGTLARPDVPKMPKNEKAQGLVIVDMPGYGLSSSKRWGELVEWYLTTSPRLRQVFLLVDARDGPKEHDKAIAEMLTEKALSWGIVITKCDAVGHASKLDAAEKQISEWISQYPQGHWLSTSARRGGWKLGVDEVRWWMLRSAGYL